MSIANDNIEILKTTKLVIDGCCYSRVKYRPNLLENCDVQIQHEVRKRKQKASDFPPPLFRKCANVIIKIQTKYIRNSDRFSKTGSKKIKQKESEFFFCRSESVDTNDIITIYMTDLLEIVTDLARRK